MIIMNDIYGTDIDATWSFSNGDINLIKGTSNLGQAIYNRLKSDLDTYNMFYNKYGGNLYEHMGDLNHETIHEYIRIEIESILKQEHRIQNLEVTVKKIGVSSVEAKLKITPISSDDVVEYNLILNDDSSIIIDEISSELTE